MRNPDLEKRRRKLERSYVMMSEFREYGLGYKSIGPLRKRVLFLLRYLEYQFLPHYFSGPPKWRMFLRRFGGKRTLPDFCVIGPIKSGSSDLAVSLLLHPAIQAPLAKEFWLAHPLTWTIFYPTEKSKKEHERIHGKALSPYLVPSLDWMELTYKLSQVKPDTKIVLTLRDPVQRFYSHWKWEYFLSGKFKAPTLPFLRSFPEFVNRSLEVFPHSRMYSACGFQALQTSIYWQAVKYWIECFGRDSVFILNMDDYFQDRMLVLRKIQDFIDVPFHEIPLVNSKTNENPLKLPPPDEESIRKLKAFFAPHNEKLWTIIGEKFDW